MYKPFATEVQLAYIAGLMDGEGGIGIYRKQNRGGKEPNYSVLVKITNTDKAVLLWVKQVTGVGYIVQKETKNPAKDSPCWDWKLRKSEISVLFPFLLPYLRVKKRHAELVLEFLALYTSRGRQEVSSDISIERAAIHEEIRELTTERCAGNLSFWGDIMRHGR
jgi:hypothetical protein